MLGEIFRIDFEGHVNISLENISNLFVWIKMSFFLSICFSATLSIEVQTSLSILCNML